MEQKPSLYPDPRCDAYTNSWYWEGYDAREAGKPYAILTTSQDWRRGWMDRDFEIEKGEPWKEPIAED